MQFVSALILQPIVEGSFTRRETTASTSYRVSLTSEASASYKFATSATQRGIESCAEIKNVLLLYNIIFSLPFDFYAEGFFLFLRLVLSNGFFPWFRYSTSCTAIF